MENDAPLGKKLHTQAHLSKRVHEAIRILEREYHDPPSVQKLADQIGVSVSHLHSIFKAIVGESIAQYCLRLRIERAAAYLKYSSWDIGEIGGLCGFQTHASFSRRFRQFYQLTPRQFRQQEIAPTFLQGNVRQKIQANDIRIKESTVHATVSEWPELSLICFRFYGPIHDIYKPWKTMLKWFKSLDLDHSQARFFGLWFDGWEALDNKKFRYECAIYIPNGDNLALPYWAYLRTVPSGLVAHATTSGSIQHIENDWMAFSMEWLPYSNYQPRGHFVMDEYPPQLLKGSLIANFIKLLCVKTPMKMCIPVQNTPVLG